MDLRRAQDPETKQIDAKPNTKKRRFPFPGLGSERFVVEWNGGFHADNARGRAVSAIGEAKYSE